MPGYNLKYKQFNEYSILIEWPHRIEKNILDDIVLFQSKIEIELTKILIESVIAYNSITLFYDNKKIGFQDLRNELINIYETLKKPITKKLNLWIIPVCYDLKFGIDLMEMSEKLDIPIKNIIELHSKSNYLVYFLGFLPGFLYLGGLPKILHFPRRDTPRDYIEKGAVAIGGGQTGIYPLVSPGGWNVIGNSPIPLFSAKDNPPCFAKAGDQVKFNSIGIEEYQLLKNKVSENSYSLIPKTVYE